MCGIIGYTGTQAAAPILLGGLLRLEYRGYDSAGIAVLSDNGLNLQKSAGRMAKLCEQTENGKRLPGCTGIGHTRWATHGAPTDRNAHPHKSADGRFAIVHNGIIENHRELREELTRQGFAFESETDTEVVAHLLQSYYTGNVQDALLRTVARLRGSYALGVLCADHPDRVFVARMASPLILGIGEGENFFASDITALISHTREVVYLEDGEIAEISPHAVTVLDENGRAVQKETHRITWDVAAAEKGGYEHFMLKEIMEQPRAAQDTVLPRIRDGRIFFEGVALSKETLSSLKRIVITACGSAYYAGCAGRIAIERLCRIPVAVELSSELRYADPLIDGNTLLIVLSQSGETADTIAALKEGKARGAHTLSVVNVVGSTIAKLADDVIYTWAGPEIAVATTKGYTTQLAVLYMLATYMADLLGTVTEEEYASLVRALLSLPEAMREVLDRNAPTLPQLAGQYGNARSVFFIGRGTDYAVALEGALKMKEISYIHAEAYAAGELKHGAIALIDEGQPVISLCCNPAVMEKTVSNMAECKARGARVLALSLLGEDGALPLADDLIRVPQTHELFAPAVEIIPLQLLAYHVALLRGCDIDKPKNLAKSVTVE